MVGSMCSTSLKTCLNQLKIITLIPHFYSHIDKSIKKLSLVRVQDSVLLRAGRLRAAREGTASSSSSLPGSYLIGCQWHHPCPYVYGWSENTPSFSLPSSPLSSPATEADSPDKPLPSPAGLDLTVQKGCNLILMKSHIGCVARQSRYAASVGWQTPFNIISG